MNKSSLVHDTFVIERSYPKTPAQVFRAFSDPDLKRRWFAEGEGHEVVSFDMDFRIGGAERLVYRLGPATPFPGTAITSDTLIHDLVPNERIVASSTMVLAERRMSCSLMTTELLATGEATLLICTHQAVYYQGSDGPQLRQAGWRALLGRIAAQLPQ